MIDNFTVSCNDFRMFQSLLYRKGEEGKWMAAESLPEFLSFFRIFRTWKYKEGKGMDNWRMFLDIVSNMILNRE